MIYEDECVVVFNEDNDTNNNFSRDRGGGCPIGTTIVFKHENELRRVKTHNDIRSKYGVEKGSLPHSKRLSRGRLNEIVEGDTSKYGLDSSDVCSSTISKRETRSKHVIVHHSGDISLTAKVEDKLVGLIIQMACIRHPVTPSSCLQLANDLICGTQNESDVIDFKNKYCFKKSKDDERLLGRCYFKDFKKEMRIVSLISVVINMK